MAHPVPLNLARVLQALLRFLSQHNLPTTQDSVDLLDQQRFRDLAKRTIGFLCLAEVTPPDIDGSELLLAIDTDDEALEGIKPLIGAVLAADPDAALVADLLRQAGADHTPSAALSSSPGVLSHPKPSFGSSGSRVLEDIKGCTYKVEEGYLEKYFERKPWTGDAQRVFESIKTQEEEYENGQWVQLRGSPDKRQVASWLLQLQERRFSDAKRSYYILNGIENDVNRRYFLLDYFSELPGDEPKRHIDILIKKKSGNPSDTKHSLKDIEVIGKLTSSDSGNDLLISLTKYANEVFACQPARRFIHAFTIRGSKMETWVYDRAGLYSGGLFDIHKEAERFIRVLSGYVMMNEDDLGLDTFIQRDGDSHVIDVDGTREGDTIRLQLDVTNRLTDDMDIVCRGTTCYRAKALDPNDNEAYVVKFAWPKAGMKSEADLLRLAKERGVQGIIKLAGCSEITSTSDLRSGMTFTKRLLTGSEDGDESAGNPSEGQWDQLSSHTDNKDSDSGDETMSLDSDNGYDDRVFHCLVISPVGRPICEFKSVMELLEALRDAIKAHQSLYKTGKILHKDITERNIIITDPKKTGFSGTLIGLDFAEEVDGEVDSEMTAGDLCTPAIDTPTIEYVAIEVLRGTKKHTYRHDIESFFYVLLWQVVYQSWDLAKDKPTFENDLSHWHTGTAEQMASEKRTDMVPSQFEEILAGFPVDFNSVKFVCREMWSTLFREEEEPFLGTPDGDPDSLYIPIIKAFDQAIESTKASEED